MARKQEISYLNILFCLLVIFIHVSSDPVSSLQKDSWQFGAVVLPWRLSSFVVQGFIFLSGLKLFLPGKKPMQYGSFYLGRFTKILIPYLLWNGIYYLYYIHIGWLEFSLPRLAEYILTGTLVSPFYFVIIILQFYLLLPLSRVLVQKVSPILAILCAVLLTWMFDRYLPQMLALIAPNHPFRYNDRVFTTYLIYWVAGCYAGANYDRFKSMLRQNRWFITGVFLLTTLCQCVFGYLHFSGRYTAPWLGLVHYCYCIITILFLYMVACAVSEKAKPMPKLLRNIDRASFPIYLSHCLVIRIADNQMAARGITGIALTYGIRTVVVYAVTLGLCILWVWGKGQLKQRLKKKTI